MLLQIRAISPPGSNKKQQETLLASLLTRQDVAATQASSLSTELNNAKSDLASYMEAIEEDRRSGGGSGGWVLGFDRKRGGGGEGAVTPWCVLKLTSKWAHSVLKLRR